MFADKDSNDLILIDVLNINLDYKKIENEDGLMKTLNHRLSKKRKEKDFDSEHVKSNFKSALIQPFIWIYDVDIIFKHIDFFKSVMIENTLPILCLRQRSNNEGKLFYDCVDLENFK